VSGWFRVSTGVRQGSVLSLILINAIINETANKVRGENKNSDMRTLIFVNDVMIWWNEENETIEKPYQWNTH
jgi:hypothetical protein